MGAKYSAEASTPEDLAHHLRAAANGMDTASFRSWKFWVGFIWGAVVIAALDFGDVHLCLGACDSDARRIIDAVEAMP